MTLLVMDPTPPIDSEVQLPASLSKSTKRQRATRYLLLLFGWLNVSLGFVGMFLPLMPTTVFLLVALWCFSRSSPRLTRWLYCNPRFGPILQDWHKYHVVPLHAKFLATAMMLMSLAVVYFSFANAAFVLALMGVIFSIVLGYLYSCPHQRPQISDGEV